MNPQAEKVRQAALTCLTFVQDSPTPHTIVSLFFERLSRNGAWTNSEVAQVRALVSERLPHFDVTHA